MSHWTQHAGIDSEGRKPSVPSETGNAQSLAQMNQGANQRLESLQEFHRSPQSPLER
jgi:hypothetical protein